MDNLLIVPSVQCRWYVLGVHSQFQLRVWKRARELGFEAYFPMSKSVVVVRGRQREIRRPLMPGYVFIAMPAIEPRFDYFQNDDLGSTEPIRGCFGFVPDANGPRGVVADDIIQSMRDQEAKGEFDITGKSEDGKYLVARWVKRGVLVRFVKGPFTGYLGLIDRVLGPSLVRVDVTIFGRVSSMDTPMDWIERVR